MVGRDFNADYGLILSPAPITFSATGGLFISGAGHQGYFPEKGIFILVVLLIGLLNWMSVARLVRGNILRLREMEFVKAAIAMGAGSNHIIWRHLLPNVLNLIIVAASLAVGNAIITESTLSFLGLGFPPMCPPGARCFTPPRII
ncbi:ABC transporter permease subunit [Synechocystis sp. B12]|nr:ABC transporter permease subunit [Synechocystis sp. B12]